VDILSVKTDSGSSTVYIGETFKNLTHYLPDKKSVIITDENIRRLYSGYFPDIPVITIGTGERIKTLATVEYIIRELIKYDLDRSGFIIGIGGGIVSDITGFAASVFLRGVKFGFVSTSLLSQVDAGIGGKNGVNLDGFKNMIGVFNQPEFIICDINMLHTLPDAEISNGMAEIVKHALIADNDLFDFIEKNYSKALKLDDETIYRMVRECVKIKLSVVQQDEKESGERRKLNFGHTIGHAIESIEQKGHGRAVSMGMVAAAIFSEKKGFLSSKDVLRIVSLLTNLNLPVSFDYFKHDIIWAISKDKKKQGDKLFFVFLEKIGKAWIEKIDLQEINDLWPI
jgi:3-dehydroquinate synthase